MQINQLSKEIYHVLIPRRKDLSKTFIRFVEYYQSPEFMGKFFTLQEFEKWYKNNSDSGKKSKKFTYYNDFNEGFGFPSWVLDAFYCDNFNPLSVFEGDLLNNFNYIYQHNPRFFIVGTNANSHPNSLMHELSHAFFYLYSDYRKSAKSIISKISPETKQEIINFFAAKCAYHKRFIGDEIHASLFDCLPDFRAKGIDTRELTAIRGELKKNFENYRNKIRISQ